MKHDVESIISWNNASSLSILSRGASHKYVSRNQYLLVNLHTYH